MQAHVGIGCKERIFCFLDIVILCKAQSVPIVVLGAPIGTQRYQEAIHTCAYSLSSSSYQTMTAIAILIIVLKTIGKQVCPLIMLSEINIWAAYINAINHKSYFWALTLSLQ